MQKQYNYHADRIAASLPVNKTNKLKRMHLVSNAMSTILEESATNKVQQRMYKIYVKVPMYNKLFKLFNLCCNYFFKHILCSK